MDAETPDDDLGTWGVRLDEPAGPPAGPHPPPAEAPAAPPRLSLRSREVPAGDFQPRLRRDGL